MFLQELQDAVPSAENIDYYIPDLLDQSRRRQVLTAASTLSILARDASLDSADHFDPVEQELRWRTRGRPRNVFRASEGPPDGRKNRKIRH